MGAIASKRDLGLLLLLAIVMTVFHVGATRPLYSDFVKHTNFSLFSSLPRGPVPPCAASSCTYIL